MVSATGHVVERGCVALNMMAVNLGLDGGNVW